MVMTISNFLLLLAILLVGGLLTVMLVLFAFVKLLGRRTTG